MHGREGFGGVAKIPSQHGSPKELLELHPRFRSAHLGMTQRPMSLINMGIDQCTPPMPTPPHLPREIRPYKVPLLILVP